jgi:hypothetical protein
VDEIKEIRARWRKVKEDGGIDDWEPGDWYRGVVEANDDIPVLLHRIDELERWVTQLLRDKTIEAA